MNTSLKQAVVLQKPNSAASEQYRKLFNNLESLDSQSPFKTVTLASINRHLNKVKTLINLGILYAKNNQKTLIMDFNARSLDVSSALELTAKHSMNDLLSQKVASSKAIQRLDENLDCLVVSPLTDDSINNVSSLSIRHLLDSLLSSYDKILIDSPALNDYSEGFMYAKATDATLLVLASRKTDGISAKNIVKELKENQIRLLGTVLTEVNPRELSGGYKFFNVKK